MTGANRPHTLTTEEGRELIRRIEARPGEVLIWCEVVNQDDGVFIEAGAALKYLMTELRGLREEVELAAAQTNDPATAEQLRAALAGTLRLRLN